MEINLITDTQLIQDLETHIKVIQHLYQNVRATTEGVPTQRNNDVIITSNDVPTSFWRNNDVVIASCAPLGIDCNGISLSWRNL